MGQTEAVESLRTSNTADPTGHYTLEGSILGAGFASGDRVVVGMWDTSPVGSMLDVMWAEPDGWRTLIVPDQRIGAFISAIYTFDTVIIDETLRRSMHGTTMSLDWSGAALEFTLGRSAPFPPRPDWVTTHIEAPIARSVLSVETHGVSPTGVEETYKARRLRRLVDGWAVVAGRDLGSLGPPTPRCGFGFSEPPPFPSLTELTTSISDPEGRLYGVLDHGVLDQ